MSDLNITAPRYALLEGRTQCWTCHAAIPVTAIWIAEFLDCEDEEYPERGETAVLHYIQQLDPETLAHLAQMAPWVKSGYSNAAGLAYLSNHCEVCGSLQGDHHVMGVNGPFFPQDEASLEALVVIPGHGQIAAAATPAQSSWMDKVRLPAGAE
ncbi:hypothetical protein H8Z72_23200 (plasmid) [Xanthomonas citri pv. citri]|uniref:hypothetical protein n=1 Tax=Xanthomonas citri TaxID=346 RepID=UPI0019321B8A|nr:hypothetical protein [Xanthomonas citri]QRD62777.1 hypothetical protein H8Z74_22985 [Xanthomonas citri pv. citri]QRD67104.1 hypothetical protein H8Z73_23070 [Xanthomonas citri pv. citri]QRD71643.1 hypothetical protein H8Z72_23200 [Xanthomonas citri pv. citri]